MGLRQTFRPELSPGHPLTSKPSLTPSSTWAMNPERRSAEDREHRKKRLTPEDKW